MTRAAICIGINDYDYVSPLTGCENDARFIHERLSRHYDNSPNVASRLCLASETRLTKAELRRLATELFTKPELEVAIFYFAGHGSRTDSGPFLISQDARDADEGLAMGNLITKANESTARERIIILDCCHSGAIDQLFGSAQNIPLSKGVSILAASRDTETSQEIGGRGIFTTKVCDALDGGAADVTGSVTVASVYAYVDQVLALWEQRPLFKANVSKLVSLREAEPAVSKDKLRKLVDYFPTPDFVFQLDPSYEPTADPHHEENEAIFADLQRFRGARLLAPHGTEHMYYAAMDSRACSLTPLGRFYRARVEAGKI